MIFTAWFSQLIRNLRNPPAALVSRIILGLLVASESLISVFWIFELSNLGGAYAFMAVFPYAYILITYVSLLLFYHFKRFEYSTFTQLAMLLVMPFLMQWIIGGFEASSGVAIWAILSPVGALLILGTRQSTPWFFLFFALTIISWAMNDLFAGYALPMPAHTKHMFFIVNVGGAASILYFVMRYFEAQKSRIMRVLDETNSELVVEQQKSERLLLNVMPKSIADRLKNKDERIADRYDSVTIMFADLVGFTRISSEMPAAELVELLNQVFSRFDLLVEKYGVEKIKTIGDAYMVVSGAPVVRDDHAAVMAELAMEMLQTLNELAFATGKPLKMRIGINSGPVIAGVIGNSKFSYDLWGDTVNMASRMEHYGVANSVQISESTYHLLQSGYVFEKRIGLDIKGIGVVDTYLLQGRKG
jgi:adenylate cyclase